MADFWRVVSQANDGGVRLPLTHATDGWAFRGIAETKALEPTKPCPPFAEPLLYFFYGRPAYRVAAGEPSASVSAYAPVCFILDPQLIAQAKRILPFDTGCFAQGRLKNFFHDKMQPDDFCLQVCEDSPSRLIKLFFGSAVSYFNGQVISGLTFAPLSFEINSYYALICDKSRSDYDDRISTIEVHFDHSVPLKGHLLGAVLPQIFLDDDRTKKFFADVGGDAWPYNLRQRLAPKEYQNSLYEMVEQFLLSKGFMP